MQDKLFRFILILSAIVIPIIGGGIIYSLTNDAASAFRQFGFWEFIFSDDWNYTPGNESYGALPFITGTLLTTFLALLFVFRSPCRWPFSWANISAVRKSRPS